MFNFYNLHTCMHEVEFSANFTPFARFKLLGLAALWVCDCVQTFEAYYM